MIALLLLLACGEEDEVDPGELCLQEDHTCCYDNECADGEICNTSWTCVTRGGVLDCSEIVGTYSCHEVCTSEDHTCEGLTDVCQAVEHVQGGNTVETVEACF